VQKRALTRLRELRDRGESQAIAVLASGLGKTYLSAFDIAAFERERGSPARTLFLAHRAPILDQAEASYRRVFGSSRSYAQRLGAEFGTEADFVFASFQSFAASAGVPAEFDYIVVDEAHHTRAPTYERTIRSLRPAFRLGLTATPFRGDGQDVLEAYGDNVAISLPLERALAEGLLTPIDYRVYTDIADPNSLRSILRGGAARRAAASPRSRTDADIARAIEREAQTVDGVRKVLVFCADLEQMYRYAKLFEGADTVAGADGRARQLASIRRFAAGETEVLLSRDVLNEGLDVPDASTLVFLRNTESASVFLQQLGRGLRIAPGKERVVVLDFVANLERIEFLYGFYSRLRTEQHARARVRTGSVPRSRLNLDARAMDVVRELVRKKVEAEHLVGVDGIAASFDYGISTATVRRWVADGRLTPDVIASGADEPLFELATVRQLHRLALSMRSGEELLTEQDFARAIRQPRRWVRRMQERGLLTAAWVHEGPRGGLRLLFDEGDVERHRQG
jgi:superfamily II DNA or RNA helicase